MSFHFNQQKTLKQVLVLSSRVGFFLGITFSLLIVRIVIGGKNMPFYRYCTLRHRMHLPRPNRHISGQGRFRTPQKN